ncbi:MAG: CcdB family protein [Pseudomonadota bacterium]
MARFDIHRAPAGNGYVLDIQSDLLDGLTTRVVVPLMPIDDAPHPARILNPVIDLPDGPHVLVTQFLSAVPTSILGASAGNLVDRSDDVTRAVDFLFQGF